MTSQKQLFLDLIIDRLRELQDRKIPEVSKDRLEDIINDLEELDLD